MQRLQRILLKAQSSPFYLWLFNQVLWRVIPFNKPHGVKIVSITNEQVMVILPYRKRNMNHLKGMHACALATLCEYACGMGLMTRIDPERFRIILRGIKVDYHTQAKTDITATFRIDQLTLESKVINPLQEQGSIIETFHVDAYDRQNKKVCTGEITWQLKRWDLVKKQR
jgi:acyl-coenzyme A thioesterase PaaI-like protein